jgi:hypothetical protein
VSAWWHKRIDDNSEASSSSMPVGGSREAVHPEPG